MRILSRTMLAATSGLALWTGFAPVELWFSPILGIAALFFVLSNSSLKVRLLNAFVAGTFFFLPLLHWSSTYVGSTPWLILALSQALIFSTMGFASFRRNFLGVATFAAFFTILELSRMKAPFGGFGWGRIGFTQVDSFGILYPFLGIAGITFLVVVLSSLLVVNNKSLIVGLALISLVFFLTSTEKSKEDLNSTFNITAVQGGVGELGLDYNSRALDILKRHVSASPDSSPSRLILWPENAIDIDPTQNQKAKEILSNFLQKQQSLLMAGVVEQSIKGPKNSSIVYDKNGDEFSRYVKQDLAPFGEYMPLRNLAQKISPYAQQVSDFVAGSKWNPVSIDDWQFQSFICFEILDDDHVRQGAKNMDFLVAQTNNATFGESPQARQQLQITRARAAELRKEFAVVSTTGFTAHLDQLGQIVDSLPQFKPGALEMELNRAGADTPANRLTTPIWVVFCMLIGLVGVGLYRR